MDSNALSEIAANTFSGLSNLTAVNLTNNRLRKFSINSLSVTLGGKEEDEGSFQLWLLALA